MPIIINARKRSRMPRRFGKFKASAKKIRDGDYRASGKNNQKAIQQISNEIATLKKSIRIVKPSVVFYKRRFDEITTIAESASHVEWLKLNDFPGNMTKLFDYSNIYQPNNRAIVKYYSIHLNFKMHTDGELTTPLTFTIIVFSPKKNYKQAVTHANQAYVRDPSTWVPGKEWTYTNEAARPNGRNNVFLNSKFFKVHKYKKFTLASQVGADGFNATASEFYKNIKLFIPDNTEYTKIAATGSAGGDSNTFDTIPFEDIPYCKQKYMVVFMSGFKYGTSGDPLKLNITGTIRVKTLQNLEFNNGT